MSLETRAALISLGAGLFLGSIYFFLLNKDVNLLSASLVPVQEPTEEIDLSVPPVFGSADLKESSFNSAKKSAIVVCQLGSSVSSSVYLNEIAWMGSGSDAKAEWLELKNFSSSSVDLNGWQVLDKTQNIKISISGDIKGGGFRVFYRGSDFAGTINNSDEVLSLFNSKCELVDEVRAAPAWPAGKSDGRTAERGSDLTWHTSVEIGGTPNTENSSDHRGVQWPGQQAVVTTTIITSSTPISSFSINPTLPSKVNTGSSQILISEVMVGNDTSGSYEFIELYNAGSATADLSGWSIKKLSSTGAESSLVSKTRLEGINLPAGKYLLIANEKGYSGSPAADILWPGSYSLAYKENGINLYNTEGVLVDELYWPEIPKNQSYNRTSWDAANFKLNSPTPQNSQSFPN